MEKLTLELALFCDILWLIAFFICLPVLKGNPTKAKYFFFLWLFITFYATFEFTGGDFYHYQTIYDQVVLSPFDRSHLEIFYHRLIQLLPSSYFIWRSVVWGFAAFFWIKILRNLKQDVRFAGLMFLLVVFFFFVGGRQALCFAVLYYGLTVYEKSEKKNLKNTLIFGGFIVCAYFLHKSAVIYILILLFSLLPLGKKSIILSLVLFVPLYKAFDVLVNVFIMEYSLYNEETSESFLRYMEGESLDSNLFGLLQLFINRLPIFLLLIYSIRKVFFQKTELARIYVVLLRMVYILIYTSYLFVGREISAYIAPRFWDASLFPLTLFAGGYMFDKRKTRFFKICFYLLLLSQFYRFAYNIYIIE